MQNKIWLTLRLALGFLFLWAFFDKLFGLGFNTEAGKSWLDGVSPTAGFLKFGTHGPFVSLYQTLAGSSLVDWLFMFGLAGIGLGLILGIMVLISAWSGVVLMVLVYLAIMPPEHNPILDEHIIYILVLIGLAIRPKDNWWTHTKFVDKYPWLA